MDSDSLIKPKDMPAVGALYPKQFAERGYWWWKAQEISYALRPKLQTLQILENRFAEKLRNMAVFQIRRTDKTQGCSTVYGKNSKIKCKREANAPQLFEFFQTLDNFAENTPKYIQIVTDDTQIHEEILGISEKRYWFLNIEPAPKRVPDKEMKGGVFRHRALKDALDILTMSFGNPFIFTYSSGFGGLALQIKQVRENFCSNWSSLDWGKREWPPIGTIGEGGVRGVKKNAGVVSKICKVSVDAVTTMPEDQYCSVTLRKSGGLGPAIISRCNC